MALAGIDGEVNIEADKVISIRAAGATLKSVMAWIKEHGAISFEIPEELEDETVTATVSASNWRRAIRQLLSGFSYIELLGKQGELQRVIVVKEGEAPDEVAPDAPPPPPAPPPVAPASINVPR